MSEVPRGWVWATLGEVCEVILGQSPPGSSYNEKGFGEPFFQGKAEFGALRPTVRKWTTQPTKLAEENDVLVSVRAPVGPTNLAPVRCAIGRGLAALRPLDHVDPRYVLHAIRASESVLAAKGTGSTFTAISGAVLRSHVIPVPPLAEQRRIVAAIEEQLSRLDAAEASLRRAVLNLKRLRSAALADALRGSWPTRPLASILVSLRNGMFVSRPGPEPPGVAIFRISAVRPLALDVNDVRYASVDPESCGDFLVDEGDLLFTRYSGNPDYVGACARVPRLSRPTLHPDKLIRAVVDRSVADSAYVEIACATGVTRDEIRTRRKTTAGQVGIAGGQLKTVQVPVPPLDEQRRIVAEVDQQLSLVDSLAAAIDSGLRRSAALRRAILARAFAGELVPQDPDDEPASALLERIAAERAASAQPRRNTRRCVGDVHSGRY